MAALFHLFQITTILDGFLQSVEENLGCWNQRDYIFFGNHFLVVIIASLLEFK